MQICLYVLEDCDQCLWVKDSLTVSNIPYNTAIVDELTTLKEYFQKLLGSFSTPMVKIIEDEIATYIIRGDQEKQQININTFVDYYQGIPNLLYKIEKYHEK